MTAEYLRHEYTWSGHCITGNVLGWGITASSSPKDREMLRELEKIASPAEPDRINGILTEELAYSPVCGFVKMAVTAADAGEDNRKNKKVFLWQPSVDTEDPDVYMAPQGGWEDEGENDYLSPVTIEREYGEPESILMEMHVYDRLPDFLRAVFWCLFEKNQGLNIVAPEWTDESFSRKAGELMYAVHRILPPVLCKKAGYISYTDQPSTREAFYFSKVACGEHVLHLSSFASEESAGYTSELEEYFFYHLAELLVTKDPLFACFMREADAYLKKNTNGNELKKLEWRFYMFCQKNGKDPIAREGLLPGIPELLYWASGDEGLRDAADMVLKQLHVGTWKKEEQEEYMRILLEGFTKRAQEPVCQEMDWILQDACSGKRDLFEELLGMIKERNPLAYALLLVRDMDRKGKWQHSVFEESARSFASLQKYVESLEKTEIPGEVRDQIICSGIRLLNENLFRKDQYARFDVLMRRLNRRDQWVEILKDFVNGQLGPEAGNLSDEELETACYVEQLLGKYAPREVTGVLLEEKKRREPSLPADAEICDAENGAWDAAYEKEADVAGNSPGEFLLCGYPQGFLTGCVLYLANYTLMIGHWKIALGMGGMWVLLMLNYYYMTMCEQRQSPFWKHLGLCILEGYVMEFIATLLPSQQIRLAYFIVLGLAAVGVQAYNIFRKRVKKEE